jgi:hypothetical protein
MWLVSHRAAACHQTRLFRASHGQTGSNCCNQAISLTTGLLVVKEILRLR